MIITGPIEFHIALSNVEVTLKHRWYNFLSMLSNVMSMSGIDVVQSWKLYVRFCFIFNVGSTLFQWWSTLLKQRWSDVEMLAEYVRLLSDHVRDVYNIVYSGCSEESVLFTNKSDRHINKKNRLTSYWNKLRTSITFTFTGLVSTWYCTNITTKFMSNDLIHRTN